MSKYKPRKNPKLGPPKKTRKRAKSPPKFLGETFRGKRGIDAFDQLAAIAADILPEASGLARKGKPRLLAVCARVILTAQRMRSHREDGGGKQTIQYVSEIPRPKHHEPREPEQSQ